MLLNNMKQRMKSDKAASNTVEQVIIIALAMFAALMLFRAVLKPTEDSANLLGERIEDNVKNLMEGKDPEGQVSRPGS